MGAEKNLRKKKKRKREKTEFLQIASWPFGEHIRVLIDDERRNVKTFQSDPAIFSPRTGAPVNCAITAPIQIDSRVKALVKKNKKKKKEKEGKYA